MATGPLQDNLLRDYQRDGFVLARRMFDREEIDLLRRAAKEDRELDQHSFGKSDGEGGTVRLSLWNHPWRHHLRHVRALRDDRELGGEDPRGRGISLPLENDHERREGGWRVWPGTRTTVIGTRTVSCFQS